MNDARPFSSPDIKPSETQTISDGVYRVVAPNAGMMTGPGTNTYLVGRQELAVIDPGPNLPEHIDAILNAAKHIGGKIRWILCTHTHGDHSPGAAPLKAKTGATLFGSNPLHPMQSHDPNFSPDDDWSDSDTLAWEVFTLQAVATPGHASNHWCYYLQEQKLLFTGDHIMEGSTVVITPPDGNMSHYLDSLERLLSIELLGLAPGHGHIIDQPYDIIKHTIQHRLKREQKTLDKLTILQPTTLDNLLPAVYDDVPSFLHPMARFSLQAHVDKLVTDGRVTQTNEQLKVSAP